MAYRIAALLRFRRKMCDDLLSQRFFPRHWHIGRGCGGDPGDAPSVESHDHEDDSHGGIHRPTDARISRGWVVEVLCNGRGNVVDLPQQRRGASHDGFGRFWSEFQAHRFAAVGPLCLTDLLVRPLFDAAVWHPDVQAGGGDREGDAMARGRATVEVVGASADGHTG